MDEVLLISKCWAQANDMLNRFNFVAQLVGQNINVSKTKFMKSS